MAGNKGLTSRGSSTAPSGEQSELEQFSQELSQVTADNATGP